MSLLASYFVASTNTDPAIDMNLGPGDDLQSLDGAALLPTDLDGLGERFAISQDAWSLITTTEDTWLVRLGRPLTKLLASLPDSIDHATADRYNLSADEIDLIESVLHPLAVAAIASGNQSLYEWISS